MYKIIASEHKPRITKPFEDDTSSELMAITTKSYTGDKSYSEVDVESINWDKLEHVQKSCAGTTGVYFLRFQGDLHARYCLKISDDPVSEYAGNILMNKIGIPVPAMSLIDHTRKTCKTIQTQTKKKSLELEEKHQFELADKLFDVALRLAKLDKPLLIMECVEGINFDELAMHRWATEKVNPFETSYLLGMLFIADGFILNPDRFIFWHAANLGNIRIPSKKDTPIVCIDQAIDSLRIKCPILLMETLQSRFKEVIKWVQYEITRCQSPVETVATFKPVPVAAAATSACEVELPSCSSDTALPTIDSILQSVITVAVNHNELMYEYLTPAELRKIHEYNQLEFENKLPEIFEDISSSLLRECKFKLNTAAFLRGMAAGLGNIYTLNETDIFELPKEIKPETKTALIENLNNVKKYSLDIIKDYSFARSPVSVSPSEQIDKVILHALQVGSTDNITWAKSFIEICTIFEPKETELLQQMINSYSVLLKEPSTKTEEIKQACLKEIETFIKSILAHE